MWLFVVATMNAGLVRSLSQLRNVPKIRLLTPESPWPDTALLLRLFSISNYVASVPLARTLYMFPYMFRSYLNFTSSKFCYTTRAPTFRVVRAVSFSTDGAFVEFFGPAVYPRFKPSCDDVFPMFFQMACSAQSYKIF